MFERYTEDARRALFFARYEASQLGVRSIETEHLLLGLLRVAKGLTGQLLAPYGINDIRKEVESRVERRAKISTSVEVPFSEETKNVLQFAVKEADRVLHRTVGTEHLLLGLLCQDRSVAGSILIDRGMRLESVREQVANLGHSEDDDVQLCVEVERTARHRIFERGAQPWQELCAEATGFATQIGPERVISISAVPGDGTSDNGASGFVVVWYWE